MLTSIKARIITFYMAVLFVTLSALGVFLYFSLSKIVYDSIDSSLLSKAKALATLVSMDAGDETEFRFSDEVMWEYNSPKAKSFFQIRRFNGSVIEKSASLGGAELPFRAGENRTRFETVRLKGMPARLVNFHVPIGYEQNNRKTGTPAGSKDHGLIIQCAEDIQYQANLLKRYMIVLSLSILSIMIISASGGFLIAKRALAPIKDISETIGRISASNLSERIDAEDIPEELRVMASSFDRTFERLERSFNRQKQFTADASHELRTPLSVILSQSEIILRKDRTGTEYRNTLTAIREAAKMMTAIVQKLLTIARLSADKVELKFETINPGEIIRKSVKLLTPLAEQKGISINISADEQRRTTGDRAALLELFVNLLDNAIKYNVPQGRIDISVKKEADFVVTEIRDTGIGIPESDLGKVFDRFYRVDKSRAKESGGAGLGLSICNEIARLHGGRVEIKSKAGEGTTVSVYLKVE
ncbi:MAG: ATP-binding protein [Nitrospirae bacterium]|nr:ATP-binding protein [Nitrospirota bacterium]MCL5236494.1 ATP-binding protein [Nitrospirota bacterium]